MVMLRRRLPKLSRLAWHLIGTIAALSAIGVTVVFISAVSRPTTADATASGPITGQIIGIIGRCLADENDGTAAGNPVVLSTCDGSAGQQWTVQTGKAISINGMCLGVAPDAKPFTAVGLYSCNGGTTQQWNPQSNTELVNSATGLCLADMHGRTGANNPIWVDPCAAGAAQYWTLPSLAADPSGLAMPVGNIPGWRQVFSDNFTENVPLGQFPSAVSSKWNDYLDGWKDTTGNGTYEPSQVVSIQNGVMNMYIHTQNGVHMVAAPEPKLPGTASGTTYGRYVVRFKANAIPGYKTAWLLWPDSNNQSQGEIDFPEGNLNSTFSAYLHHRNDPASQNAYETGATYTSWHTAVIQWSPTAVTFTLDGTVIGSDTVASTIPDEPMHWVLQTETQLNGGAPSDSASGNVQIDWVAVYLPQQ